MKQNLKSSLQISYDMQHVKGREAGPQLLQ